MGGLDARHLISRKIAAFSPRVLSLTTIGTPHAGTPFADVGDARFEQVIDALLAVGVDVRGFRDLTVAAAVDFNANNPNANAVSYFSIAGQFAPGLADLLRIPHEIIVAAGAGESDGLVPVASARHGEFLGIWQVDHFRLVNQGTNLILTPQELVDASIIDGYRSIVQRLVQAGF
jgi:triacylglycerol lipase